MYITKNIFQKIKGQIINEIEKSDYPSPVKLLIKSTLVNQVKVMESYLATVGQLSYVNEQRIKKVKSFHKRITICHMRKIMLLEKKLEKKIGKRKHEGKH